MVSDDGKAEIRLADAADAPVVAGIHMASRAAAMPYLPPQRRSHEQVTQWVTDVVFRTCRVWVAVRDTEILGYAALEGEVLEHLYLRPDARRQGIGTLLLDMVRQHSPEGVSLHVFEQNTDARAFYEHHGFTVLDTSDGRRNMENLPDMTLRWTPGGTVRRGRPELAAESAGPGPLLQEAQSGGTAVVQAELLYPGGADHEPPGSLWRHASATPAPHRDNDHESSFPGVNDSRYTIEKTS